MNTAHTEAHERLRAALASEQPSARLQAALTAGTHPHPEFVQLLVNQCAFESDFYVRDMLSWALTRHPVELTVPVLLREAQAGQTQARSQALHTLSKIGDPRGWRALTDDVLLDEDNEVARSAWRAAMILVPSGSESQLAAKLASQLGRGERELQLSLSRALATLGNAALPPLADAAAHRDSEVRAHALATERLLHDPDLGFDEALFEAKRIVALAQNPMASADSAVAQNLEEEHADR